MDVNDFKILNVNTTLLFHRTLLHHSWFQTCSNLLINLDVGRVILHDLLFDINFQRTLVMIGLKVQCLNETSWNGAGSSFETLLELQFIWSSVGTRFLPSSVGTVFLLSFEGTMFLPSSVRIVFLPSYKGTVFPWNPCRNSILYIILHPGLLLDFLCLLI